MVKRKQEGAKSPSPKKKFSKNMSLGAIDEVKSPKGRRKSLGNINILQNVVIKPAGAKKTPKKTPKKTDAASKELASNTKAANTGAITPTKTPKKDLNKTPKTAKTNNTAAITPTKTPKKDLKKTPKTGKTNNTGAITPTKTPKKDLKKTPKKTDIVGEELSRKFKIPKDTLKEAIKASIKALENNPKMTKDLFAEGPEPLFLRINVVKKPQTHPKIIRIPLAHSILTPDSEVCLIVAEVKDIPNKEHEKHLEYYENLLRKHKVENIKKLMTFHEFRTEYDTFEMKGKLVELYDLFLVDGRIAGKTVGKCGSIFYKKRKVPTAVKLQAKKLKEQLEMNLRKVQFQVHSQGDNFMVQFGHSKMPVESLVENVHSVLEGLEKYFPGGYDNVRSIDTKSHRGVAIPIYLTSKNQNEVEVPVSKLKLPRGCVTVRDEISTRLNTEVVVDPFGNVEIKKVDLGEMDEEQLLQNEKRAQKKKLKIKKKIQ